MEETDGHTTTLTEFLLARIAEDEAVATRGKAAFEELFGATDTALSRRYDARRVLAECEAKRRIIVRFGLYSEALEDSLAKWAIDAESVELSRTSSVAAGGKTATEGALRLLALPYADHPDYQQEWKP